MDRPAIVPLSSNWLLPRDLSVRFAFTVLRVSLISRLLPSIV